MSSHTTCEVTLSHSCLSLLSHRGLILARKVELVCMSGAPLTQKQPKKCFLGMDHPTFPQNPCKREKELLKINQTSFIMTCTTPRTLASVSVTLTHLQVMAFKRKKFQLEIWMQLSGRLLFCWCCFVVVFQGETDALAVTRDDDDYFEEGWMVWCRWFNFFFFFKVTAAIQNLRQLDGCLPLVQRGHP